MEDREDAILDKISPFNHTVSTLLFFFLLSSSPGTPTLRSFPQSMVPRHRHFSMMIFYSRCSFLFHQLLQKTVLMNGSID